MARYYVGTSIWAKILGVLIAIPVVAFLANLTYRWLLPFLPLAGGGILLILFVWVGFRHRRY